MVRESRNCTCASGKNITGLTSLTAHGSFVTTSDVSPSTTSPPLPFPLFTPILVLPLVNGTRMYTNLPAPLFTCTFSRYRAVTTSPVTSIDEFRSMVFCVPSVYLHSLPSHSSRKCGRGFDGFGTWGSLRHCFSLSVNTKAKVEKNLGYELNIASGQDNGQDI